MGAGDAYIVTPQASRRAQLAYIPPAEIAHYCVSQPQLEAWPEFDAEAIGRLPDDPPRWNYAGGELAASLVNAVQDGGRPALVKLLDESGLGRPGVTRASRLLGLGRDMRAWLESRAWCLSVHQPATHGQNPYFATETGKVVSVPGNWTDRQEN
jgi:hypothetical protein